MNNNNKPVIECIREFKLRQQYPSMTKNTKNIGKTVIINGPLKSLLPIIAKSKIHGQSKNGFHKLRLKLANGKDLGECNVQILPNNNISKDRTMTIINQNKCRTFNKPTILLSGMSKSTTKNVAGSIPFQSMNSTVKKDIVASPNTDYSHKVASNKRNKGFDVRDNNVKYQYRSILLKRNITNDKFYEGTTNKVIENMDTDDITDRGCIKNGKYKHSHIQRVLKNNKESTNEISFLESTDDLSFCRPAKVTNNIPLFPLTGAPNCSVNTSGAIAKTVEDNSNRVNSDSQKDHRIDLKCDDYNFAQHIINTICDKSLSKDIKEIRENLMVIVRNNETTSLDNGMKKIHEMNSKPINNKNHNTCSGNIPIVTATSSYENLKSPNILSNTFELNKNQSNIEQNTDEPSKEHHVDENALLKKTCFSVLKGVIDIIQKEKLKAKALEDSVNCTIEMEQHIPLSIPKDTRTLPSTEVHPRTYLLLESENVLNVKEDMSSTVEITPTELYSSNMPDNLNLNSLHYMPFYKNSIFSPFNQLEESDKLLDKCIDNNVINDICNKHSTANKVKEVLSQPNVLCNKIFEQLQRDFETVRKWDENGMLNIHKAVISNRIHDIQRHLMVLKACNVNVDMPTLSGMTSLELAIKYNASIEVVKLLLEVGANPASFQPIQESALIVASKMNSSLLPLLINHVPSSRLLDHVDSTGFTALHYCAQYGNLEGVTSLISMGANVNLQESRSGRTPLFLAIENNHPVIAKKLIEVGALLDIPNFSGHTVLSLVEKINHLTLVTKLHAARQIIEEKN